jgi:aminoglycoside phosphotransferase (APT) family kinase protein
MTTNMQRLLKSEHPALREIGESRNWIKVELVSKGWSTDLKYHIIDDLGRELLLRISEGDEFNRRKLDYERLLRLSGLGILMSMPVEFGSCCGKKYVYMILTWVIGKDAEGELDRLDRTEQYRLGIQAGHTLRVIHSLRGAPDNETWIGRYRKKIERIIELYNRCSTQLRYGGVVIDFIRSNVFRLEGREITLQHGDYHIGSFIITEDNQLGIIDFNRSSYGDPWEEYDRFIFTWRTSIPFAVGQIDGYFNRAVPENFFELMSLYNATNMLASIPWAIPFGAAEVQAMLKNCDLVFDCYDGFQSFVPHWYPITSRLAGIY